MPDKLLMFNVKQSLNRFDLRPTGSKSQCFLNQLLKRNYDYINFISDEHGNCIKIHIKREKR